MIQETPPLVAAIPEMAPEAMINEGGAIGQPHLPRRSGFRVSVDRLIRDYPIESTLTAFGSGLVLGWLIAHD
jgi:hypothetical protein